MARVITQRDGGAICGANATLRAEDQERLSPKLARIPSHPRVLCPAEEISTRGVAQKIWLERQAPGWSGCMRSHLIDASAGVSFHSALPLPILLS
jgi:hypothetical protein